MFDKNLKFLREKYNMDQIDLAEKLGRKSASSISEWEKGRYTPKIKTLAKIASIFKVDLDDLMNKDLTKNVIKKDINVIYNQLKEPRQAKVYEFAEYQLEEQNKIVNMNEYIEETMYGHLSAGSGEFLDVDIKEKVQISKTIVPDQHYDMVLQVNGDSMEPMFEDKEYVFVRKTEEVRSGQIAVFIINGESYLKKVYINDDHIRLVSLNKNYDDMVFDDIDDIKVVGTVVM